MKTLGTILAVIGGVWVIGRLSRRSPNHPVNSIGFQLTVNAGLAPKNVAPPVAPADDGDNFPYGPGQETAQIQTTLVIGEGGGE